MSDIKEGFNPSDYGVHYLRQRGYAVVIFNPDELNGADPWRVEDRLIELGNEVIHTLGGGEHSCAHDWVTNEETGRTYCLNCGEDGDG